MTTKLICYECKRNKTAYFIGCYTSYSYCLLCNIHSREVGDTFHDAGRFDSTYVCKKCFKKAQKLSKQRNVLIYVKLA